MENNTKIVEIIFKSIEEINKQNETEIPTSIDTKLFGSESDLDSLGLINLIVTVEQNIEDEFNIAITLADERAMSPDHSPFRNVESLANYIKILIEERLDDK